MVFFVIACHIKGQNEQQIDSLIRSQCLGGSGNKSYGDLHQVEIDKSRFKIGTLDQLMELNETLVKVDLTLDSTVKKIEKQAKELENQDLFIEVQELQNTHKVTVENYINSFKWQDTKYPRGKSLVELAGMIADNMRKIDNEQKKGSDELNEIKNNLAALTKGKEGSSFYTKDLGEIIYNSEKIIPELYFVEKHQCESLSTLICIVHKQKAQLFLDQYEKLIQPAAVPRSARSLDMEDKEGNMLYRVVVLTNKLDDYINEARKAGLTMKKFVYDRDQYNLEKQEIVKLESKYSYQKSQLATRSYYAFSELFVALMHLKVMRTYIDGVLRFGIPPQFYIGIMRPVKQYEKKFLQTLSDTFCDPAMKDMYGSKEDTNDTEDFWPYVLIPLTSPSFLQ